MDITVQHFNHCPNWLTTIERLALVVEDTGVEATVHLQLVNTPEAAEAHSFRGSPTILINGVDPFTNNDAPVGLSCRVYQTPGGLAGSPTVEQITQAIQQHVGASQ
jgi:hypothetical protein